MFILEPLLIAWFITHFEPIQNLIINLKFKPLINIFTCFKCTSFWVTLIYIGITTLSFGFYPAIINSIIAYTFSSIINLIPTRL